MPREDALMANFSNKSINANDETGIDSHRKCNEWPQAGGVFHFMESFVIFNVIFVIFISRKYLNVVSLKFLVYDYHGYHRWSQSKETC